MRQNTRGQLHFELHSNNHITDQETPDVRDQQVNIALIIDRLGSAACIKFFGGDCYFLGADRMVYGETQCSLSLVSRPHY